MQAVVAAGVDLALAVLAIEALVLGGLRLRTGRGLPLATIALIAMSGLGLLLALRTALAGGPPLLVALGLTAGGLAHAVDLARRLGARQG